MSKEDYPGEERRKGASSDRRSSVVDRRAGGLDRRRGAGRRLSDIRREAEAGEMDGELREFVMAMADYKKVNKCLFPSWSEVFEIIHLLGYRKVAERGEDINKLPE